MATYYIVACCHVLVIWEANNTDSVIQSSSLNKQETYKHDS